MAGAPIQTPSMPPTRNNATMPSAKSIGGSNRSFPRHSVSSQLKNSTPVGTEMSSVVMENSPSSTMPVVYRWWPQTVNDSASTSISAAITPRYPNSGLPLNTGRISEMIPHEPMMSM